MSKVGDPATSGAVDPAAGFETASVPAPRDEEAAVPAEWASEDALFAPTGAERCDACGVVLPPEDPDALGGYGVAGAGTYVWTRGDEVRVESAPLCPSCASAIGMTALARWEIEEEEG
jgi:hypothetical protein